MLSTKDFHSSVKDERKSSFKVHAGILGKKAIDGGSGTTKIDSGSMTQSKKLIFSFKKESTKQKVTPPNVSSSHVPKPSTIGHHRRVQSHGQA